MISALRSQNDYSDELFKSISLEGAELDSSEFYDCTFKDCSFVECVFRNCRFVNCLFEQCDLSLMQMPGTLFAGARFEESRIIGLNWTQADWTATRLGKPIAFLRCVVSHSTFIGLTLPEMRFEESKATDCDFREADLTGSNFGGTDLSESLFLETNLTRADFRGASNYHIPPGQNILKQAKFSLPEAMALLYGLDIVLTEDEV